jgi:hypothetical protein
MTSRRMRRPTTKLFALALLLPWMFGLGCSRNVAPPEPLPVEQLPAAFQQAFDKAQPQAKELADQVVAAVQAKDYAKALSGVQLLVSLPGLTKEQSQVTSRSLLTVNGLLQSAQAQGDPAAAQTLKVYRGTK